MIKIHIPVPTNPARFYEGELLEEFALKEFLTPHAETNQNPITSVYFKTSEGMYRLEKGDGRLYVYPPECPRYMLTEAQGEGITLSLHEPIVYSEGLETSPITEIATIRRVHQFPLAKLDSASKLYKL